MCRATPGTYVYEEIIMKKIMFKGIGGVSFSLGVLGVFLPLLPSTCFILLSAWAFSKSSPAFHDWLCNKSSFSSAIQSWHQHHVIPIKVKVIAVISICCSFTLSAMMVSNSTVLISLGFGMTVLIGFLISRPSEIHTNKVDKHEWSLRLN